MNLAEHPLALDIEKRLAAAREAGHEFLAATLLLPGMPNLMGELRSVGLGAYSLTTNVNLQAPGQPSQQGRVDFIFSPDKAIAIIYPSATEAKEPSRIVSPH